jgi:excisionase family DNA binding protein
MTIYEKLEAMDTALSIQDVAKLTSTDVTTLYRLAKKGKLPHYMVGGSIRIDPQEFAEYLRVRTVPALLDIAA